MTRTLELPVDLYDALIDAASRLGTTPASWIAEHLPARPAPAGIEPEIRRDEALARLRSYAGSVSLGYPTGTDNEQIDADLAREYGDPHEPS